MGLGLGLGLGLGFGLVGRLGEGAEVGGHEQHVRPRAQRAVLQARAHVDGDRAVGGGGEERKELALAHDVRGEAAQPLGRLLAGRHGRRARELLLGEEHG